MQYRLTFPAKPRKPAAPIAPAHPLTDLAGWAVIAALAYAPAALGCVRPWAITGLEILLTAAVALWLAGCLAEKRRPRLPLTCLVLCGLILLQGGIAVLFAAPGAVPVSVMSDLLRRIAVLLGALLLTADLAGSHPQFPRRLWWAMALTGAGVSLLGIAQKAGLTDLAARHMESHEGIYFATFNYHGNAGAFLNIAVPLCAGLVLAAVRRHGAASKEVFALASLLFLCLAGALVNVSRAAQAILLLILALYAVYCAVALYGQRRPRLPRSASRGQGTAALGVLVVLALAGVGILFRGSESGRRWGALAGMVASDRNSRTILAKVTVPMAEEAGAWGSGPGSYKMLFPHSRHLRPELYANFIVTEYVPGRQISMWSNAHNDYLQTVIEWGWLGSIPWGALLLVGLGRLLLPIILARPGQAAAPDRSFAGDAVFRFSAGLALLGMCLHALVDFPFQVASLQLYASVLLGIAWSHRPEMPEHPWKNGIISRLLMIL